MELCSFHFYIGRAMGKGVFGAYADSEGPDQTARMRILIRAVPVRWQNYYVLQNVIAYLIRSYNSLTDLPSSHDLRIHLF